MFHLEALRSSVAAPINHAESIASRSQGVCAGARGAPQGVPTGGHYFAAGRSNSAIGERSPAFAKNPPSPHI